MKNLLDTEITKADLMKRTNIINLASITGIDETTINRMHSELANNNEQTQENLVNAILEYLEMMNQV